MSIIGFIMLHCSSGRSETEGSTQIQTKTFDLLPFRSFPENSPQTRKLADRTAEVLTTTLGLTERLSTAALETDRTYIYDGNAAQLTVTGNQDLISTVSAFLRKLDEVNPALSKLASATSVTKTRGIDGELAMRDMRMRLIRIHVYPDSTTPPSVEVVLRTSIDSQDCSFPKGESRTCGDYLVTLIDVMGTKEESALATIRINYIGIADKVPASNRNGRALY